MNSQKRHKLEYLLDGLDDEDIGEASAILIELGESRQRGYHLVHDGMPRPTSTPRRLVYSFAVCLITASVISMMAAYHLVLVILAAPLFIFYSAIALRLKTVTI